MIQAAVLEYNPSQSFGRRHGSPMAGQSLAWDRWHGTKDYFVIDRSQIPPIEEELARALAQSKKAVRNRAHFIGPDQASRIIDRLNAILDPDDWEWEEGEPAPSFSSADALMQAVAAVETPVASLSITRTGNLRGMWEVEGGFLTIEGLKDGSVSWIMIRETTELIQRDVGSGSVTELQDCVAI
jgi:hypothetical protein